MLFVVTCQDRPGHMELRKQNREAHLDWAKAEGSPVKMAGPLLDENAMPVGSLLVVEAESAEKLEEFMHEDPYAKAGLFAQVTYAPFRWTVNPPEDLRQD
ncbi:YciI family protein [Marinicauda algicola]|uniref:YciI family protein n=1 Tax=Marinicauda algicola TaxID=2029849 RepID=A0A4S2H0R3_9PROT|nr:YciI family protein [Marinicauda algicola]TGY88983.1 YciI family protein [Marinicauda algicola]